MPQTISSEVIESGTSTFSIEVPYTLIESGESNSDKPLLVYLHGFGETLETFAGRSHSIVNTIEGYHLFLQGPYPIYDRHGKRKVSEWGRSWYLYDGNQEQFLESLEQTSVFLQRIIQGIQDQISANRICLIGFSMGGYLAGYFALTRYKLVNELVAVGCRIKTEVLNGDLNRLKNLQVLALHGTRDNIVDYKSQKAEIKRLSEAGINAYFKLIDQKHIFNSITTKEICEWLTNTGYTSRK